MRNKYSIISIILMAASIAGLALSVALIFEYFGVTAPVADAVCTSGRGGVNACMVVSASRFAGIRGIPFVGDVPVAAAGFVFYGFVAAALIWRGPRSDGDRALTYGLISALAGVALAGDIALYLISVFVIRFVCPLCVMTYAATAVILLSSILLFKNTTHSIGGSLSMRIKKYLKEQGLNLALIVITLCAAGMGIGAGARLMAENKESASYKDRLDRAIRLYETAKTAEIDTSDAPILGKSDSPAHFTVFFDFTCDHCRDEILQLESLVKKYPGAATVSFKFLPLAGDCGSDVKGNDGASADACIAAAGSLCAHKQNKFIEYTKILLEHYHKKGKAFTTESVGELAKTNGIDMNAFNACFSSKTTKKFMTRECREAEKIGVGSTPTLFLNGKLLTAGSRRPDILEGLVQYCVRRATAK